MARQHAAGALVGLKEHIAAGNLFLARCFAIVCGKDHTCPPHSRTHDHGNEEKNDKKMLLHA